MRFLCEFEDELYPFEGVTNERNSVRAIVLDKYGRIALLHHKSIINSREHLKMFL